MLLAASRLRPAAGVLALLGLAACSRPAPEAPAGSATASAPAPPARPSDPAPWTGGPPFRDVAADVGLRFVHHAGVSGEYHLPEVVGPGVALLDVDADGDLDVYLVQAGPLDPRGRLLAAAVPQDVSPPHRGRLFRNDLTVAPDGARALRFTDVTDASGLDATDYALGAAVGDVDGDGLDDLLVTCLGRDRLWRSRGDGTFEDVTERAGVGDARFSTSAAFLDHDGDGDLDLYVAHYVVYDLEDPEACHGDTSERDYCGPLSFPPEPDSLWENLGDGTFRDVSVASGIASAAGSGLGVSVADFDGDGRPDVFVANDGMANRLWMNRGDGTFTDRALLAGCAYNRDGAAEASMGVDAADFDGDGDEDLFMTHLRGETNTLYVNDGRGLFTDRTTQLGLGDPSRTLTGFGTAFVDFDNDGLLDLLAVNGAVKVIEAQRRAGEPFPLRQRNQLFRNRGELAFAELGDAAGEAFRRERVSRGAALGDLDDDGDVDVVVGNANGPVELLLNEVGAGRAWVGLRPVEAGGRRVAVGTRVAVVLADGRTLWRRSRADGSYASANDPRVLVGLGDVAGPVTARAAWADGAVEEWGPLETGRYHDLRRGAGRPVRATP